MDARPQVVQIDIFKRDWRNITRYLAEEISKVDLDDLSREYEELRRRAPGRQEVGITYFTGHDGRLSTRREIKGSRSCRLEEHLAIALWRMGGFWPSVSAGKVRLLDYQFPLDPTRNARTVDLLGATDCGQLTVIELKVKPKADQKRGDSPMAALIQALGYAAIVDANRAAIAEEVKYRFGEEVSEEPPIVQILGPKAWWRGWLELPSSTRKAAGRWEQEFVRLARDIEKQLDIVVEFVALDDVQCSDIDYGSDGRQPQVGRALAVYPVYPGDPSTIGPPLRVPQIGG